MKHMEDSRTENTYLIMNKHINGYGRLFGGVLMQWIDEMAGIVAYRHAGTIVTTACVDNLNFKAGAYLGDTVVLIGKLTYVKSNFAATATTSGHWVWTLPEPGSRHSIYGMRFLMPVVCPLIPVVAWVLGRIHPLIN